jgi:hypothetical protein
MPVTYVRKKVQSYKWPVKIEAPADGGRFDISTMTVEFKRVSQSKALELAKDGSQLVREVVIGWEDYMDEDGKAIPFTSSELNELADDTPFVRAAGKAFFDSLAGAQEGN